MDKRKLLNLIIDDVKLKYESLIQSAQQAKDAATNEESKAENKYDTRGLEASYLAGAQAERSEKMKESLFYLQKINDSDLQRKNKIGLLSLVSLTNDNDEIKNLFILPAQGGIKLNFEGKNIQTITLTSPIGAVILNKEVDDEVILKQGKSQKSYEINSID